MNNVTKVVLGSLYKKLADNYQLKKPNKAYNDFIKEKLLSSDYTYVYDGTTIQEICMEKLTIVFEINNGYGYSVRDLKVFRYDGETEYDYTDEPLSLDTLELLVDKILESVVIQWDLDPKDTENNFLEDCEAYAELKTKEPF